MENKQELTFREKSIVYLTQIIEKEGYEPKDACELAFYIAKVLEDSIPLLESIERNESNSEKVLDKIHMFFTNLHAFGEGKKLLMHGN